MDTSLLLCMINNVALLLVLGIILDFTGPMHRFNKPFLQKLVSGTLVGVLGIAVILTPWDLRLGFVLNSRTIFFAIAGLFFGPIPLVAAVLMSGLFQFAQGGSGVLWGLLPIITSAALGLLWRLVRWRGRDLAAISIQEWVLFALLVHSVLAFELLPQTRMFPPDQWIRIGLIILVVYPLATVLLGIFMAGRLDRSRKLSALEDSGERRKIPLQNAAKIITDNSTQQKHAEERRLHPMEYFRRETDGLAAIVHLSSELRKVQTYEEVLPVLVTISSEVLKAENGALVTFENDILTLSTAKGRWMSLRNANYPPEKGD